VGEIPAQETRATTDRGNGSVKPGGIKKSQHNGNEKRRKKERDQGGELAFGRRAK